MVIVGQRRKTQSSSSNSDINRNTLQVALMMMMFKARARRVDGRRIVGRMNDSRCTKIKKETRPTDSVKSCNANYSSNCSALVIFRNKYANPSQGCGCRRGGNWSLQSG